LKDAPNWGKSIKTNLDAFNVLQERLHLLEHNDSTTTTAKLSNKVFPRISFNSKIILLFPYWEKGMGALRAERRKACRNV